MNKIGFYLLFCTFSIHLNAQSTLFNTIYFDGELGLLSFGNEEPFFFGATDLSIGYRMTPQWAVGASLIAWTEPGSCCGGASASGTGVQLRYTPKQKGLMLKVEPGYLLQAWYPDDYYLVKWNRDISQKHYFRVSADWRFGTFTTGLTWASVRGQFVDYFDRTNLVFSERFNVTAVSVHIGFAMLGWHKSD
jgi:hypothetical protein